MHYLVLLFTTSLAVYGQLIPVSNQAVFDLTVHENSHPRVHGWGAAHCDYSGKYDKRTIYYLLIPKTGSSTIRNLPEYYWCDLEAAQANDLLIITVRDPVSRFLSAVGTICHRFLNCNKMSRHATIEHVLKKCYAKIDWNEHLTPQSWFIAGIPKLLKQREQKTVPPIHILKTPDITTFYFDAPVHNQGKLRKHYFGDFPISDDLRKAIQLLYNEDYKMLERLGVSF